MMLATTPLAVIKATKWFLEDFYPFLKKWYKELIIVGLAIALFFCCKGCGSVGGSGGSVVTTTATDTVYKFVYVNEWQNVLGDTVAYYEEQLAAKKWVVPVLKPLDGVSTADSLYEYKGATEYLTGALNDCDSTYRADYAFRAYVDTTETDSFKLAYSLPINGELAGRPTFGVFWKIPQKETVVTNTITNEITLPPRRSIYFGLEAGARMHAVDSLANQFNGAVFGLEVGIMNRKGWQYGAEVNYDTRNNYAVLVNLRRNLYFGK